MRLMWSILMQANYVCARELRHANNLLFHSKRDLPITCYTYKNEGIFEKNADFLYTGNKICNLL